VERPEQARLDAFLHRITERFPANGHASSLIITHLLTERPAFLRAMARTTDVAAVLPKPKSVSQQTLTDISSTYTVRTLTRDLFADPSTALAFLEDHAPDRTVILLDVGGYYAPSLDILTEKFSGHIAGVIEDTENGHQRYEALGQLPCPVFSVARSPLKHCEDHLVGRSIVFSTDALIRSRGDLLTGRDSCVIGYGKIGRSIAHALRAYDVRVTVFDIDPVRRIQARAEGFRTPSSRTDALRDAACVLCATGNIALGDADFEALSNGAYVASATSAEDELDLAALHSTYRRTLVTDHLTRYETTSHYFYVLADGNAVNFLHGAVVGTYIHLVQAEILAATSLLTGGGYSPRLHEVPYDARQTIARTWLDHFTR
jgi:adenosylhomocysteinase